MYHDKSELIEREIRADETVLDVGFLGQGIKSDSARWPHALLKKKAKEVYGLDLVLDSEYRNDPHYMEASAEDFSTPVRFDVVFAGDLIEHLSNPGLFLARSREVLKSGGRLIMTTPNAFNLFNLAEKLTKREPTVNPDHTCYFNDKTLSVLLQKNGMRVEKVDYLYTLGYEHKESWKKKALNAIYALLSRFTTKFAETLVVIATPR